MNEKISVPIWLLIVVALAFSVILYREASQEPEVVVEVQKVEVIPEVVDEIISTDEDIFVTSAEAFSLAGDMVVWAVERDLSSMRQGNRDLEKLTETMAQQRDERRELLRELNNKRRE